MGATYAEISPQAIPISGCLAPPAGLNYPSLTYIKYSNQTCNKFTLIMKVVFRAAKDCSCLVQT